MALISCQECGGQVSTFAAACPHCGFPMDRNVVSGVRTDDYTKLVYQGIIIDITSVLEMLHRGDAYMAQLEMSDAYEDTQILYDENTTAAMLQKAVKNYEKIYGEKPPKLPPCLLKANQNSEVTPCPVCGSYDLVQQGGFLLGLPDVERAAQFLCRKCGHTWEQE